MKVGFKRTAAIEGSPGDPQVTLLNVHTSTFSASKPHSSGWIEEETAPKFHPSRVSKLPAAVFTSLDRNFLLRLEQEPTVWVDHVAQRAARLLPSPLEEGPLQLKPLAEEPTNRKRERPAAGEDEPENHRPKPKVFTALAREQHRLYKVHPVVQLS